MLSSAQRRITIMIKRMLAVLPLLCVLMIAMGGSGTAPTAAAPMTPSVSAPTAPAMCEPPVQDPGFGACRWYCGSHSYATQALCQAHCGFECEQIC
jgi:hypothetical protein